MKSLILNITVAAFVLLLVGCTEEGSESNLEKSFTAKIDGDNFVAREDLIFGLGIGSGYLSVGGSNDNIVDVKTIDFTIETGNTVELAIGLEISDADPNFDVLANYADFDQDIDAWSDETGGSFNIKITNIDYKKELVSGEFNFVLVDDDKNTVYIITDGVFKNVPF